MSNKLFEPVAEKHDGKGRVVFICKDKNGFYVFKPQTGFKTRHWKDRKSKTLKSCFERQVACTQNTGFFEAGENPAADEDYSLETVEADQPNGNIQQIAPVIPPAVDSQSTEKVNSDTPVNTPTE